MIEIEIDTAKILGITDGKGRSYTPEHARLHLFETFEPRDTYDMSPEVREWCLEQFDFEPIIHANHRKIIDEDCDFTYYISTYSTVFTDHRQAVAFKMRWL